MTLFDTLFICIPHSISYSSIIFVCFSVCKPLEPKKHMVLSENKESCSSFLFILQFRLTSLYSDLKSNELSTSTVTSLIVSISVLSSAIYNTISFCL